MPFKLHQQAARPPKVRHAVPDDGVAPRRADGDRPLNGDPLGNGAYCPLCGSTRIYHFSDQLTYKCGDCRKHFSIKVGTIFEGSKIELRKWFMAMWLITSHKKGIASTSLTEGIGRDAENRLAHAPSPAPCSAHAVFNKQLDGEVEIDETYVGGKNANRYKGHPKNKRGGFVGKTVLIGARERGGKAAATVIDRTDTATLDGFAHAVVSPNAVSISTDEHSGYRHLGRTFNHGAVRHSAGEYVANGHHTSGIEGFCSLLRRQIVGIHHFVSSKHLNAYVAESTWRFHLREIGGGAHVTTLLAETNGRLRYKELIA